MWITQIQKNGLVRKVRDWSNLRLPETSEIWPKILICQPVSEIPPNPPLIKGGRGDFWQACGWRQNPLSLLLRCPSTDHRRKLIEHVLFEQSPKFKVVRWLESRKYRPGQTPGRGLFYSIPDAPAVPGWTEPEEAILR